GRPAPYNAGSSDRSGEAARWSPTFGSENGRIPPSLRNVTCGARWCSWLPQESPPQRRHAQRCGLPDFRECDGWWIAIALSTLRAVRPVNGVFMRFRFVAMTALLVLGLCVGSGDAFAQQLAIYGTVTDQRGELAGVRVTLTGSVSKETLTDADGRYRFEGLAVGSFRVEFTWGGQEVAVREVALGQSAQELNVTLAVEGGNTGTAHPFHPRSTVVVTATRTEAEADRAPISTSVITPREIEARPLRNVDQQLTLTEGVYVQRLQGMSATDSQVSVRGFNNSSRTLVLLDGQP